MYNLRNAIYNLRRFSKCAQHICICLWWPIESPAAILVTAYCRAVTAYYRTVATGSRSVPLNAAFTALHVYTSVTESTQLVSSYSHMGLTDGECVA